MEKTLILNIVKEIFSMKSSNCRGLDKGGLARKLMDFANIPQNAEIQEIPLDWNNQVVILFLLPDDKNYYSLFSGIGNDRKFYFELSITGQFQKDGYFNFYENEKILPLDFFKSKNLEKENISKKLQEI